MNHLVKFFHKYKLAFIGLLIVLSFIWLRYIRQRFSKDIPLQYLSIRGFIIITFICCIYILIVKSLIKPSQKSNIFSEYIVPLFYIPLESFDVVFKETFKIDVEAWALKHFESLEYILTKTYIYYFTLAIFPRLVLVTVLFFDTFYFHRLHFIYYFIYLTILLFFNKYIIYSLKVVKKDSMKLLTLHLLDINCNFDETAFTQEERDDPEFYDNDTGVMSLPVERFFDYIVNRLVYHQYSLNLYTYLDCNYSKYYYDTFSHKDVDIRLEEKQTIYLPKIENTIKIACLIEEYSYAHNNNKRLKYIKILIFSTYFLCWFYILKESLPKLNVLLLIDYLNFYSYWFDDPFSGY